MNSRLLLHIHPHTLVSVHKILCRNVTKDCLLTKVSRNERHPIGKKVTIVGSGSAGATAAFTILSKDVTEEICLLDVDEKKIAGEMSDLVQGAIYLNDPQITATTDYAMTANSNVCIVTVGLPDNTDDPPPVLIQRRVDLFKTIIPNLMKYSPETILLIVSSPVDVMTYIAWKLSGLPVNRVLGTGTALDSARFRTFISQRLGICPSAIDAFIIGEHGDSSVPVWSSVSVAGVRLTKLNPKIGTEEDDEKWIDVHKDVIEAAVKIVKLKGHITWSIGLVAGALTKAILRNSNEVQPVCTSANVSWGFSVTLIRMEIAIINLYPLKFYRGIIGRMRSNPLYQQ